MMKKIAISILLVGMAKLCLAQNSYAFFDLDGFEAFEAFGKNYEYLNAVQNEFSPNQVQYLEGLVPHWDVTQSDEFDGRRGRPFNVRFRMSHSDLKARYDHRGKIISAVERYRDFAIPKPVGNEILRKYPNWKIIKTKYFVRYNLGNPTEKIFEVQIQKEKQKKWLRIYASGQVS